MGVCGTLRARARTETRRGAVGVVVGGGNGEFDGDGDVDVDVGGGIEDVVVGATLAFFRRSWILFLYASFSSLTSLRPCLRRLTS